MGVEEEHRTPYITIRGLREHVWRNIKMSTRLYRDGRSSEMVFKASVGHLLKDLRWLRQFPHDITYQEALGIDREYPTRDGMKNVRVGKLMEGQHGQH